MIDLNIEINTLRESWLDEKGLTDGDVCVDYFGGEYVYEINEDGVKERVYLPNFKEELIQQ